MANWVNLDNRIINLDSITRVIRVGPSELDYRIYFADDPPQNPRYLSPKELAKVLEELVKDGAVLPEWKEPPDPKNAGWDIR